MSFNEKEVLMVTDSGYLRSGVELFLTELMYTWIKESIEV